MANQLLNALKVEANHVTTENGGASYASTMCKVQDLFALGGAYRSRTDAECINLFLNAFNEDADYTMKCLFYLGDVRGGQGERRFFRVVTRWLANNKTEVMRRNLKYVPEYTRWDNLYEFVGTPLEKDAFDMMYHQLALDIQCTTPSLMAKWLKSENTSSPKSRALGLKTRKAFGMTAREYRKTLSKLRATINVLERLMSENRWDEIEFDQIPSKAGFIYRNAFARHDLQRAKEGKMTYEDFAKSADTKVNADVLYPCEVVSRARSMGRYSLEDTQRLMLNKYWDNLKDYFNGAVFNGVAVVDTSASMTWGSDSNVQPIDVAVALGLYCADKCSPKSPWAGHYITFSRKASLVECSGVDFVDKVNNIVRQNLCQNTNIKSVFDLLLQNAIANGLTQEDMPENIVVISDMEFDQCANFGGTGWKPLAGETWYQSEMEAIANEWNAMGYKMPNLVFWNVNARSDQIPMQAKGGVTFVSGYSPVLFESLLSGKTGWDFVKDKLDSERYAPITAR